MNKVQGQPTTDRRPAPSHDNRPKLIAAAVATGTVLVVMSTFFWAMAHTDPNSAITAVPPAVTASPEPSPAATAEPAPEPTPTPTAVETPPAPTSNELTSNDWVLSPYAVIREQGNLVVTGTLQNLAAADRSATIRVFVYVSGSPVAVGVGEVRDVPAGQSVEVALPSGAAWTAGNKVLLVQAEDIS